MIALIISIIGALTMLYALLSRTMTKTKEILTITGIVIAILPILLQIRTMKWQEEKTESEITAIRSLPAQEDEQGYFILGVTKEEDQTYYVFLAESGDTLRTEKAKMGVGFVVDAPEEGAYYEEKKWTYGLREDLSWWQKNLVMPFMKHISDTLITHYLHVPSNTLLKDIDNQ